jgi:hypothetical protein
MAQSAHSGSQKGTRLSAKKSELAKAQAFVLPDVSDLLKDSSER